MKKFIALVLALVVVFSFTAVAFAGPSATGTKADNNATADVPVVLAATEGAILVPTDDPVLTVEQKEEVEAAFATLEQNVPEGYVSQYIFYALTGDNEGPVEYTLDVENATDVVVKLCVNGVWQVLPYKIVNGKLVITVPCDGVLVVFTK